MKILLIFPKIEHGVTTHKDKGSWGSIIFGYPSITLPHLAALTPKKHSVKILNENYEDIDYEEEYDLIGITCLTMTAPRVYEIADEYRKRGMKVVLGGYHPSALPKEAKEHADSIILGEAEISWLSLLKDLERGKLKPFYEQKENIDMASLPEIRWDLVHHKPILGGIQTTRGCPYNCEFCAISSFFDRTVKQRPIENVVEEMKHMPHRLFIIHDPSLTINVRYTRSLFKEMIKEKVNKGWIANGNVNALARVDEKFLELARKSGCLEWFVGFESISQESLNGTKKPNKAKDFHRMVKRVRKYGMGIQGGIIFGFDQDTPDIFDSTLDALYELGIDVMEFNILTPYPGTKLFERLERENRILTKDWSRYNQVDVVFQPKNMSPKELLDGTKKVAKEFYSMPKIFRRGFGVIKMSKKLSSSLLLSGTNFAFRKYYRRDFTLN